MTDSESKPLPFGSFEKTPDIRDRFPTLPAVQDLLSRIKSQVDKAKTLEIKTGYIDIGIEEFKQIKVKGWRQYHALTEQHDLPDPQPFWDYDADLDQAISELGIIRQSLLIADAARAASAKAPTPAPSKVPVFGASAALTPTPPDPKASSPDVMDIKQLAEYLKGSESWLYKHYKEEGIPYFLLGTNLRFRKDEVDEWVSNRGKAGTLIPPTTTPPHSGIGTDASERPVPAAQSDSSKPNAQPIEVLEERVHPQTLARINRLIALLWEKDYLSQSDSQRLKNWILRGSKLDSGEAPLSWLKLRKSLVTCVVLCQHAGLISINETKGKVPPRPDYAATIERDYTAEHKPRLQNIDRDYAKDIEEEVSFFTSHVQAYAKNNELDFPLDNILLSALNEYFDDIDGSEGMAEEATAIVDGCKSLDFSMLRLFHSLANEC